VHCATFLKSGTIIVTFSPWLSFPHDCELCPGYWCYTQSNSELSRVSEPVRAGSIDTTTTTSSSSKYGDRSASNTPISSSTSTFTRFPYTSSAGGKDIDYKKVPSLSRFLFVFIECFYWIHFKNLLVIYFVKIKCRVFSLLVFSFSY